MKQTEADQVLHELFGGSGNDTRSGMVVRDAEIAYLLIMSADWMAVTPCDQPECVACDMFHTVWWGWCNDLVRPVRVRLQRLMSELGIPLPPSPVEVWSRDAVPAAR